MDGKRIWKPAAISLILILSFIVIVTSMKEVSATDRYVGGGGTPNYANINAAISASSSGDNIYVAYGSYSENVVVNVAVNIYGVMSGSDRPAITGSGSSPVFDITVNGGVKIVDFEIYGTESNIAGIRSSDDPNQEYGVEIDNCKIHGFQGSGCGIKLRNGANFHWIHDCMIYDNGDGIHMVTGSSQVGNQNCLIEDNEIYSNSDEGVYNEGDYNWFEDNVIHNNAGNGIEMYYSDDCWISTTYYGPSICEIYSNDYGVYADHSDDLTIIGSSNDDYNYQVSIHNNTNSGIYVVDCDSLQVSYTTTYGNTHGMDICNSTNGIMDHLIVSDDIYFYNCHYWAVSLSTISLVVQDPQCSNIVIT